MKLKTFIRQAAMLILLATHVHALAETITYTANYDYSKLTIGIDTLAGESYATIHYKGILNDYTPGMPSLPVDIIQVSVPYNATDFDVSAASTNFYQPTISYPVYPCQVPKSIFDTTGLVTPPDELTYSKALYPSSNSISWIVDDGFIAGENHIVTIAIMPIQIRHNATTSNYQLRCANSIIVSLRYSIIDTLAVCPLVCLDTEKRHEGYELTKSIVVNPQNVIDNAPGSNTSNLLLYGNNRIPTLPSYFVDSLNQSEIDYRIYDYMVITTDSLVSTLRRLSGFKKQKGYNVGIVTVDNIVNNPLIDVNRLVADGLIEDSYDYPSIIRLFLTYNYVYGKAKYVLLAGKDVPYYIMTDSSPTDIYYCDLSSNWYASNRFIKPELFPGRIIAKTQEQIKNYTDKLFRYELNPGNGDYSYLKRALYTNGNDQYVDSISYMDKVRIETDSIYTESFAMLENRQTGYPSGKNVIDEINNTQYGFINFNNHGIPTGIVTSVKIENEHRKFRWLWAADSVHGPISATTHVQDDTISGNALNNMTNKLYPNICFSTCCSVMPYGVPNGYNPAWLNFGESFTTGKDYGGPAFLGNTIENGFEMADLGSLFAYNLRVNNSHIGIAHSLSRVKFSIYYSSSHNLLGDPEFEVWTDTPQLYSNIGISRTNNSISISGIAADSTIVAYYDNSGLIGTDTISTSTVTLTDVSPNSTVMLYKRNYIPYIAPMSLQNVTLSCDQYVIASDVTAGSDIDSNRTCGDVTVASGTEYEIEASGAVRLEDGFKVEKGAAFAVYPSCF